MPKSIPSKIIVVFFKSNVCLYEILSCNSVVEVIIIKFALVFDSKRENLRGNFVISINLHIKLVTCFQGKTVSCCCLSLTIVS